MVEQCRRLSGVLLFFLFLGMQSEAAAFSFSAHEAREAQEEASVKEKRTKRVEELMSVPCRASLAKTKTAIIIGEATDDRGWETKQEKFGPLFDEVNRRLRRVGVKTYTQEEITSQIAQEEIQAFLGNDPDRAVAAAKKLKADYILRGTISSKIRLNPVVHVNELFVAMTFTLVDAKGKTVASITEQGDSFAGADTLGAALVLVRDKADLVVATLYNGLCGAGGPPASATAARTPPAPRATAIDSRESAAKSIQDF